MLQACSRLIKHIRHRLDFRAIVCAHVLCDPLRGILPGPFGQTISERCKNKSVLCVSCAILFVWCANHSVLGRGDQGRYTAFRIIFGMHVRHTLHVSINPVQLAMLAIVPAAFSMPRWSQRSLDSYRRRTIEGAGSLGDPRLRSNTAEVCHRLAQ